jgi:hypothetical protein
VIAPASPLSWAQKKLTKSTENCYSIQEGRIIERSKGRFISPVRVKNKQRSASPSAHSISSIRTISTSTPTQTTVSNSNNNTLGRLHCRNRLANVFDFDKEEVERKRNRTVCAFNDDDDDVDDEIDKSSIKSHSQYLNRTIGGYSVPYREKRNPLSSTRLSCYKPIQVEHKFDYHTLKNYKSVDDFLTMEAHNNNNNSDNDKSATIDLSELRVERQEVPKISTKVEDSSEKSKKRGFGSKFRSMSGKTQRLLSKLYSSSNNLKSSSEVCNEFTLVKPNQNAKVTESQSSRRSLSYGMLPDFSKEFEVASKIKTTAETQEDGDSGILVNESGASSMIETESDEKTPDEDEKIKSKKINEKHVHR